MGQINIDPDSGRTVRDDNAGARSAASNNLTWAIGMVIIIAAIAIAVVFVGHQAHLF